MKTIVVAGLVAITVGGLTSGALAQTFTGPYVGVFGGYGTGTSSQHDNGFVYTPPAVMVPGGEGEGGIANQDGRYGIRGGLGGGLVGYNFQYGQFLIGGEGDIAASAIKGRSFSCGTPAHECGTSIGTMADVRGRLGLPFGQFMPFVAGGLAIDNIKAYDTLFGNSGGGFRAGYTVGAGVEYKINAQLAVRVEYLYAHFSPSTSFAIVPGVPERISATTNTVRGGIVYNFLMPVTAPVVARY